ncbi:MAG: winged helix-turn-helix transcriptional regulator [Tepidiformaceae bacterium]
MGSMGTRAAAERKSYNHPCTIARTLDVLGDRWTLLILRDLMAGLYRYSDILENCGGMSPNVLSDRLKRLEADGLVERKYFKELPPRVEYSLTERGWAVRPVLLSLIAWGNEFLEPLSTDAVGTDVPQDFGMRTVPAFTFNPDRAEGITATMVVEIQDCSDCNTWSFEITDGQIRPRRNAIEHADIRLKATTEGFFRFIHGSATPAECGELEGSPEIAARIQSCFAAS